MAMASNIQLLQPGQNRTRHKRSPNFPVAGVMKPYGLYPIFAHVVLPGETLNSATLKWRCLSMPVAHPLAGAWLESWFVYVKFTDLDRALGEMFVSSSFSTTGYTAGATSSRYFTKAGQIDWIRLCTERFHDAFFAPDHTPRTIDGVRQTRRSVASWYQNMIFEPAAEALVTTDTSATYEQMSAWQMLQQMALTEVTYEKYLEQYGVKSIAASEGDPELLRYARSWTQPVNTVEPTTGAPSSAWVWSDEIKLDKAKRFSEPGFVVCVAAVRPKMFEKNIDYSFLGNLWGFQDFYPIYNIEDPTAGIKTLADSDPVFGADFRTDVGAVSMLYDHRDLLSHGEQFINERSGPYPLPMSTGMKGNDASDPQDLRGEYCTLADVDALFTGATNKFCYYEGIGHLDVSGNVTDTTR